MRSQILFHFRKTFAARWAAFLNENYDSPEHVAVAFGVCGATAKLWPEGAHRPIGDAVSIAWERHPDSAKKHLSINT